MIRIASASEGSQTIVTIAGKLEADHLADVEAHCATAQETVILDLSELQSADEAALGWLRSHIERGGRVTGASPYIRLQLERGQKGSKGETSAGNSGGSHG